VLEEESLISPKTLLEIRCCFDCTNVKPIFWSNSAWCVHGLYCVQERICRDVCSSSCYELVVEASRIICFCQIIISHKPELEWELWFCSWVSLLIKFSKTYISIDENECCRLIEPSAYSFWSTFILYICIKDWIYRFVKHVAK